LESGTKKGEPGAKRGLKILFAGIVLAFDDSGKDRAKLKAGQDELYVR
jgi:hypothetical protein